MVSNNYKVRNAVSRQANPPFNPTDKSVINAISSFQTLIMDILILDETQGLRLMYIQSLFGTKSAPAS